MVEMEYIFAGKEVHIRCLLPESLRKARLTLPVIASPQEKETVSGNTIQISKQGGTLQLESRQTLTIAPTNENGRIFNPVPGFSFIPVTVHPDSQGKVEVTMRLIE